jgi:RHS repeat-associated protein
MIGYQYDADGNRVGKGTVTNWQSCDITTNGYQPTNDFVLDQSGSQMTEMEILNSASGTTVSLAHSNVTANGGLFVSFDSLYNQHYYLNDALGSRRAQTDPAGIPEQTCQSLAFGDQLLCTGGSVSSPTEHHYTGKERDTESGLDYFGARYYASNMGRWMSPDWNSVPDSVPYANLSDPQSLNLYSYTRNNPLSRSDPDGHCDIDGEHHGGVWCFFHKLGWTETQHEVANDLRTYYQGLTYTPKNGSPIDVAGQSDADIIKFNQDHREEFANAHWAVGLIGPIAAGASGAMLGANGTQVTSKTLWEDGKEHIDVENPNPGQRPGQIHYQDSSNNKYIYDVKTGQFEGLSNSQSKQLLSKPEVQQAIQKGLNYLGEGK